MVIRIDRFVRSIKDHEDILYWLKEHSIVLKAMAQTVGTCSAGGEAVSINLSSVLRKK